MMIISEVMKVVKNQKTRKKKVAKKTAAKKTVRRIKKIDFNFYAPLSKKVALGGDFNNWKPEKHPLKGSKKGVWKTSLKLKPGRYEYRFLIDGNWENDNQRQTELVGNSFGQTNNVLFVG
jgi:1,4-alpha-glucan branching enzyme